MKRLNYSIKGIFGNKMNRIKLCVNKKSDELIVLLHGAYSSPFSDRDKRYEYLFQKLSPFISVGFYQTSRIFEVQKKPQLTFEKFRDLSFKGKTFCQELSDVKESFVEIVNETKKETGKCKLRITLVGFSLGGTMSVLLTKVSKEIDNIFLFGSGISFASKNPPILDSIPSETQISKILVEFRGNIFICRGSDDRQATHEKAYEIYESAKNSNLKLFIELKDVDHRFILKNKKKEEEKLNELIFKFILGNKNLKF